MIDEILSRLQKVRRTGKESWIACCPAHDDKTPSLTIRALADGTTLCNCHGGCGFGEVVDAVGLPLSAWFAPKEVDTSVAPPRRVYPAADVLEALAFETTLVAVAACNLANGVVLTTEDKDRILLAYQRIQAGRDMALGKH